MAVAASIFFKRLASGQLLQRAESSDSLQDDPRVAEYRKSPNKKIAMELGYTWPQLNRKTFADRMKLEAVMVDNMIQFIIYLVLVVLYLGSVITVTPIGPSSIVGQELKRHLNAEAPRDLDDVMSYTKRFLQSAYDLAPALVDIHTRNVLDVKRCFTPEHTDICSATRFWSSPVANQDINFLYWSYDAVGMRQNSTILSPACQMDMCGTKPCGYKGLMRLSPLSFRWGNITMETLDYNQQSMRGSRCMYRQTHTSLANFLMMGANHRSNWLVPELPLVLKRIKNYTRPYMLLATPLVMQRSGKIKPCKGLGEEYVDKLTGSCPDPSKCDQSTMKPIDNSIQHPFSNRSWTAWVSYSEPVIQCVDLTDEDKDFKDKSFNAWRSFEKLTEGDAQKGEYMGQDFSWKFVSDIRQLQAPLEPILVCPSILHAPNGSSGIFILNWDEYGVERPVITDPKRCGQCENDSECKGYFEKRYVAAMLRWSPLATGRQMLRLAMQAEPTLFAGFVDAGGKDATWYCHVIALVVDGIEDTRQQPMDNAELFGRCGERFGRADLGYTPIFNGTDEQEAPAVDCQEFAWLDERPFQCFLSGRCIPLSNRCNGIVNCDDGTDEVECNIKEECLTLAGHFCSNYADGKWFNLSFADCKQKCISQNCSGGYWERAYSVYSRGCILFGGSIKPGVHCQLDRHGVAVNLDCTPRDDIVDPTVNSPNWAASLFHPSIFLWDNRTGSWWGRDRAVPILQMFFRLRDEVIEHVILRLKKGTLLDFEVSVRALIAREIGDLNPLTSPEHELWCVNPHCRMTAKCLETAAASQHQYEKELSAFITDRQRISRYVDTRHERDEADCLAKLFFITENMILSNSLHKPYPSVRELWQQAYMDLPPSGRQNTFLTRATSEYRLALLVLTPQAGGLQEVITTVQVIFKFGPYGNVETEFSHVSMAGKLPPKWWELMLATIFVCSLYLLVNIALTVLGVREQRALKLQEERSFKKRQVVDIMLPLVMVTHLLVLWQTSKHGSVTTAKLLREGFEATGLEGREKKLFLFLGELAKHHSSVQLVKNVGVAIGFAMFIRLVAYMAVHPRIALLVNTILEIADDFCHFMITFCSIFAMLGVMAFWMFGENMTEFNSPFKAMHMQAKMLVGDFSALDHAANPLFVPYCLLFMVLVFLILMNFFLAIVVDGFMTVKATIKDDEGESNFPFDFVLAIARLVNTWRGHFPSPRALRHYALFQLDEKLEIGQKSEIEVHVLGNEKAANAVTAEELFEYVRGYGDKHLFQSTEHARSFLLTYAHRFPHLLETDLELCFREGDYMDREVNGLLSESSAPRKSSLMHAVMKLHPFKSDEAKLDVQVEESQASNITDAVSI